MLKKKSILNFGIIIILLLSIFPSITSQSFKTESEKSTINQSISIKPTKNIGSIKLNVLTCKNDGIVEKRIKTISRTELADMKSDLNQITQSDSSHIEKFENVLEKLKEFNFISNDIELKDICNVDQFEKNISEFKNVTNQNFMAHFAPILIVGGGFGLGVGFQQKGLFNSFSHFLAVVGGLAFVLCVDFFEETIYSLISVMLPVLIGYIAGYTGIIIFAVAPGLFYSNLLMIGLAPFTCWIVFPPVEEED